MLRAWEGPLTGLTGSKCIGPEAACAEPQPALAAGTEGWD